MNITTDTSPKQSHPSADKYELSVATEHDDQAPTASLQDVDAADDVLVLQDNPPQHAQFFALRQGRYTKSCIYINEQDLLPQIEGFDGALFMLFDSWEKAHNYIQELPHPSIQEAAIIDNNSNFAQDGTEQLEEDSNWERKFREIASFHSDHGTSDVPAHTDLGHFAAQQRLEYRQCIGNKPSFLTQDRVERLKTIDFCFGGPKDRKKFFTCVDELVRYRSKNEMRDPPSGSMLSKWIVNMQKRYLEFNRGNTSVAGMDAAKCEVLDGLGFDWTNEAPAAVEVLPGDQVVHPKTLEMGAAVSEIVEQALIPNVSKVEELQLITQTVELAEVDTAELASVAIGPEQAGAHLLLSTLEGHEVQHAENNLTHSILPSKKRKADFLISEGCWDTMYEELKQFKAKHGHCIPPVQPVTRMRQWVDKVRLEYKKLRAGNLSLLTAQRIQSLNDIGFLFERKVKPRTWEQRFQELTRFKESFGHCKVPRLFNQPSYEGLGKWVADQRMKHNYMERGKKSNMTQERAKRLTDLGMVWSIFKLPPKEERAERKPWGHRYQDLLEFKKQHGHTLVPQVRMHFPSGQTSS